MWLPANGLRRVGLAAQPGAGVDRLGHEHHGVLRRKLCKGGPLAAFLRSAGEGQFLGDHRARVGALDPPVELTPLTPRAVACGAGRGHQQHQRRRQGPR
jgi:hypothetical protein